MDRESVENFTEKADSILEASPQMDEANTKAAVLNDFLGLLGWEIPTNTQLEYSVEVFGKTYKVDYALILEGTPVAFFEAKGVDTSLKSNHERQLSDYMKNKDVDYGILSNGREYRFYQRRVNANNVRVQKIIDVTLRELPDWIPVLNEYTKTAIEQGGSGELERINDLREARQALESEKDELAIEITEILTDRISDTVSSHAESQSKELIDRLIDDIESEIGSEHVRDQPPDPEPPDEVDAEYVVEVQDGDNTLATFESDNQSDLMASVVDYFIANRDLISKIKPLPYVPGEKYAMINDRPVHADGSEMRVCRKLTDGNYLFTSLNKGSKKRHLRILADKSGLEIETRGNW